MPFKTGIEQSCVTKERAQLQARSRSVAMLVSVRLLRVMAECMRSRSAVQRRGAVIARVRKLVQRITSVIRLASDCRRVFRVLLLMLRMLMRVEAVTLTVIVIEVVTRRERHMWLATMQLLLGAIQQRLQTRERAFQQERLCNNLQHLRLLEATLESRDEVARIRQLSTHTA